MNIRRQTESRVRYELDQNRTDYYTVEDDGTYDFIRGHIDYAKQRLFNIIFISFIAIEDDPNDILGAGIRYEFVRINPLRFKIRDIPDDDDEVKRVIQKWVDDQIDRYNLELELGAVAIQKIEIQKMVPVPIFQVRPMMAHSRYVYSQQMEAYQFRSLRLGGKVSCIMESLALIYYYLILGLDDKRDKLGEFDWWKTMVFQFRKEVLSKECRRRIDECNVLEAVKEFNKILLAENDGQAISKNCIDVYRCADDSLYHCAPQGVVPLWFLCYDANHVVPMRDEALFLMRFDGKEHVKQTLIAAERKKDIFKIKSNVAATREKIEQATTGKHDIPGLTKAIKRGKYIGPLAGDNELLKEVAAKAQEKLKTERESVFESYGWAALDFETTTDNERCHIGLGNQRPTLLTFAGKLNMETEEGKVVQLDLEPKDAIEMHSQSFWGESCADDFVRYLVLAGFYQKSDLIVGKQVDQNGNPLPAEQLMKNKISYKRKRVINLWACHNGSRFDFKFLIAAFQKYMGQVQIIGTASKPKGFICMGNYFYDTSLIYRNSLEKLGGQMLPADTRKMTLEDLQNGNVFFGNQKIDIRELNVYVAMPHSHFVQMSDLEKLAYQVYCMQDSITCLKIFKSMWKQFYCSPFNNHYYLSNKVGTPCSPSASALALKIFRDCFLEEDIEIKEHLLRPEKLSYRGALTQVWKTEMKAGVSIDIKSSYPSAMYNLMPFRALSFHEQKWPYKEGKETLDKIMELPPYTLYSLVDFEFPEGTHFPTLVCKYYNAAENFKMSGKPITKDIREKVRKDVEQNSDYSIIQPLKQTGSRCHMWGVELQQAILAGASLKVTHYVEYEGKRTHKNFIDYFFNKRNTVSKMKKLFELDMKYSQCSQALKDNISFYYPEHEDLVKSLEQYENLAAINDTDLKKTLKEKSKMCDTISDYCKLFMNSLYGKHGQKYFEKYFIGTLDDCVERGEQLIRNEMLRDMEDLELYFVNNGTIPLYEMQYKEKGDDLKFIGTTVRFASYITAIARCNLMRAVKAIENVIGKESIVYCDTDSVFIDLPMSAAEEQIYQDFRRQYWLNRDGLLHDSYKDFIQSLDSFKAIHEIQLQDIRHLDNPDMVIPMIPKEEVLGAYCIEKFILQGYFMGPKQYMVIFKEGKNKIDTMLKIKGNTISSNASIDDMKVHPHLNKNKLIKRKDQLVIDFIGMVDQWKLGRYESAGMIACNMQVFRDVGLSKHVSQQLKIIKPSLLKREYWFDEDGVAHSRPWINSVEYYKAVASIKGKQKNVPQAMRAVNPEAFKDYDYDPSVSSLKEANKYNALVAMEHVRLNNIRERNSLEYKGLLDVLAMVYILSDKKEVDKTLRRNYMAVRAELFKKYRDDDKYWGLQPNQIQQILFNVQTLAGFVTLMEIKDRDFNPAVLDFESAALFEQIKARVFNCTSIKEGKKIKMKKLYSRAAAIMNSEVCLLTQDCDIEDQEMVASLKKNTDARTLSDLLQVYFDAFAQQIEEQSEERKKEQDKKNMEANGSRISYEAFSDDILRQIFTAYKYKQFQNPGVLVLRILREYTKDPQFWSFKDTHGGSDSNWHFMNGLSKACANATVKRLKALQIHPFFNKEAQNQGNGRSLEEQQKDQNDKYSAVFDVNDIECDVRNDDAVFDVEPIFNKWRVRGQLLNLKSKRMNHCPSPTRSEILGEFGSAGLDSQSVESFESHVPIQRSRQDCVEIARLGPRMVIDAVQPRLPASSNIQDDDSPFPVVNSQVEQNFSSLQKLIRDLQEEEERIRQEHLLAQKTLVDQQMEEVDSVEEEKVQDRYAAAYDRRAALKRKRLQTFFEQEAEECSGSEEEEDSEKSVLSDRRNFSGVERAYKRQRKN